MSREISLYKKLLKYGVEITFLTYGDESDFNYSDLLKGIRIVPILGMIKSKIPKFKFIKSLFLPFKLKKIFRNIDIIKTNQVEGSWIGCIAKILYRKKLIVRAGFEGLRNYITLSKVKGRKNYFKYLFYYFKIYILEFIAYKMADKIILTSELDINFILKKFKLEKKKKNIFHFYNFIDVDLFKPMNLEKKDKHVLFIGILYTAKNLINLLNAFKDLKGFTLDIIGKGKQKEILKKLAKELGIRVNFLGRFPNEQLPEIINQYQIFILPSYYEGNPRVLLESMSCGVACIGTNVRGISNLIKHKENGYLCEIDSKSIREAILTLYRDKKLREKIGQNAREFILNNCSLDLILKKEFSLYKSLFY
ncbi:MAG: glycosyltransferase family 4 protein [Promethearchaeota archaeon]